MVDPQHTDWRIVAITASITTLIGAVVGFISALISEIWKANRAEQRETEKLERAIYAEMTDLYFSLRSMLKDCKESKGTEWEIDDPTAARVAKSYTVIDSYRYAKANPHLFYGIKHASTINTIYSSLIHMLAEEESSDRSILIDAQSFCSYVMHAIKEDRINSKLFRGISPDTYEDVQEDIKELEQKLAERRKARENAASR